MALLSYINKEYAQLRNEPRQKGFFKIAEQTKMEQQRDNGKQLSF